MPNPSFFSRSFDLDSLRCACATACLALVVAAGSAACSGPALTEGDRVIVADFANSTGDVLFDESLRQLVGLQMQQSPFFTVLSDQRLQRTLRGMQRPPEAPLTGDAARDACVRAGAKAVVGGTIASEGTQYTITLEAVECQTAKSLARSSATAATKADVIARVGEATSALRRSLGEPSASQQQFNVSATQSTTASLEALHAYAMGNKVRAAVNDDAAIAFFRKATEVDPGFALAASRLGVVSASTGRVGDARKWAAQAFTLQERATAYDRAYIQWNYAARITHESATVQRTLGDLVKTFPRDFAARNNLGVYHIGRGEFDAALEQYRAASEIAPDEPVPQANIAFTLLFLGRRDEAYDAIAKLLLTRPDGGVAVTRWLSAVAAGDSRAAEFEQAAASLVPPPQMLVSRTAAALWRGQLKEYERLQAELRTQARAANNADATASVAAGEAMTRAAYERGRAIDALRTTLANTKIPVVVAQGAMLLASLGATDAAQSLLPQFEPASPNAQILLIPTIVVHAYLDAANGRTKEAAASLDAVLTEFPQAVDLNLHLGRLREQAGDLDGAIAAYRTLVRAQPILGINASVVPARLYLAEVLAKKGDAAGARAELDALLAQWKGADSEFILLKMARDARQKVGS